MAQLMNLLLILHLLQLTKAWVRASRIKAFHTMRLGSKPRKPIKIRPFSFRMSRSLLLPPPGPSSVSSPDFPQAKKAKEAKERVKDETQKGPQSSSGPKGGHSFSHLRPQSPTPEGKPRNDAQSGGEGAAFPETAGQQFTGEHGDVPITAWMLKTRLQERTARSRQCVNWQPGANLSNLAM